MQEANNMTKTEQLYEGKAKKATATKKESTI